MLIRSTALSEDDLLNVARTHGQDHLRAISRRASCPRRSPTPSSQRADDDTLGVLLRNRRTPACRATPHEAAVDRAAANPDLHDAVIDRHSLPPDLLNDMYFVVEARLRDRILERNAAA